MVSSLHGVSAVMPLGVAAGAVLAADYGEAVVLSVRVAADEVPRYRQDLPDAFAGAVEFVDSP